MPKRISSLIGTTTKALESKGVFDGFIDIDSRLHIDPSLLRNTRIKEFKNAQDDFENYFQEVLTLIKYSKKEGDKLWNKAWEKLQFKERGNIALGYSKDGTKGSAIGPILARNILTTASEIVKIGINDPIIFELIGIVEDNIGADRISDMTAVILYHNLLAFTKRIAAELKIKTKTFEIEEIIYELPKNNVTGEHIVFIPKKLLSGLPIAESWDDIDIVGKYNERLRNKLNKIIGKSWKSVIRKLNKKDLKQLLLENPEAFRDLIRQYKAKPRVGYNFETDPLGEIIWAELSERAPKEHPLNLRSYHPITNQNILIVVQKICEHFKDLIECNGWFEYL